MFKWLYESPLGNVLGAAPETQAEKAQNAVMTGNIETLTALIREGFDALHYFESQNALIHLAAYHGQLNMIKFLESIGSSLVLKGREGNTPLHYACFRNHSECVVFLLERGCYIGEQNTAGMTPYDMCKNLVLRQQLLPYVMADVRANPDKYTDQKPNEPSAVPGVNVSLDRADNMNTGVPLQAFAHPSLRARANVSGSPQGSTSELAPFSPPLVDSSVPSTISAVPSASPPVQNVGFGFANKGPRVNSHMPSPLVQLVKQDAPISPFAAPQQLSPMVQSQPLPIIGFSSAALPSVNTSVSEPSALAPPVPPVTTISPAPSQAPVIIPTNDSPPATESSFVPFSVGSNAPIVTSSLSRSSSAKPFIAPANIPFGLSASVSPSVSSPVPVASSPMVSFSTPVSTPSLPLPIMMNREKQVVENTIQLPSPSSPSVPEYDQPISPVQFLMPNQPVIMKSNAPRPKATKPRIRSQPDGFITTVGNAELSQKYGNVTAKSDTTSPPPPIS